MIKIAEYMALGKPIVQFDLKEGRYTAGDASLYSAGENLVSDFADKILWLLDHPEERQRMGELGKKRVADHLAWKHSVSNLISAYERVFQKKGWITHNLASSNPESKAISSKIANSAE
jgi:glycosyltransferase involved in cell wall biosynthesis